MSTLVGQHQRWSSSTRFVIACAAAIISLSNVWRLPYLVDEYGGGAFLLIYVLALLSMGLPLFSGQLLLARGTRADVPGVIAGWTREAPHSRAWVWGGAIAVIGAGLLLACYGVIAGWSLAYCLRGVAGLLGDTTVAGAQEQFVTLARDAEKGFGWQLVFIGLTVATVARGLRRGVEPVMRTLGVLILLGFAALLVAASLSPSAGEAARALFVADFSDMTWRGALEALYQAFFTLSLGTGVILALGSYLDERAPVVRLSVAVIALDLAASLAAAFVLGVFLRDADIAMDAGLQALFQVLPAALAQGASWRAPIVFALIALVALSTAIGLFEPVVRMIERRAGISRLRAAVYAGLAVWLLGLFGLLSFDVLADARWLGYGVFDLMLRISTHAILPGVGLLLCLLLGRVLSQARLERAWKVHPGRAGHVGFVLWYGSLRYPTRIALVIVLVYSLGGVTLVERIW